MDVWSGSGSNWWFGNPRRSRRRRGGRPGHAPALAAGPARNGFTLVELLLVIAVISVLAALLMPALRRSVEVARSVRCTSNLKQLGMGMQMYADENYGRTVHPSSNYVGSTAYNWMGFLGSFYLNNNAGGLNTKYLPAGLRCDAGNRFDQCYGMNLYYGLAVNRHGMRYMKKPGMTIAIGDGGYWDDSGSWNWSVTFGTNRWKQYYKFRHFNTDGRAEMNGRMNVLFGDLHADSIASQFGPYQDDARLKITTPHEQCRLLNPWYPDDYCNGHPGTGGRESL